MLIESYLTTPQRYMAVVLATDSPEFLYVMGYENGRGYTSNSSHAKLYPSMPELKASLPKHPEREDKHCNVFFALEEEPNLLYHVDFPDRSFYLEELELATEFVYGLLWQLRRPE